MEKPYYGKFFNFLAQGKKTKNTPDQKKFNSNIVKRRIIYIKNKDYKIFKTAESAAKYINKQ